jgi:HD domain
MFPKGDWAKTTMDGRPGLSVLDHCLNAGCVAEELTARLRNPVVERKLAVWLAGCHDIGKISPGFLRKCPEWLATARSRIPLDDVGELRRRELAEELGALFGQPRTCHMLIRIIYPPSGGWVADARALSAIREFRVQELLPQAFVAVPAAKSPAAGAGVE